MQHLSGPAFRAHLYSGRRFLTCSMNVAQQVLCDREELLDFFPRVLKDIKEASSVVAIPDETEWLAKTLSYNVPHGKMARSCTALNACRHLVPSQYQHLSQRLAWSVEMTLSYNVPHGKMARSCTALNACRHLVPSQYQHLSQRLAWSVEMLQGAYIIVDDMCDGGLQRRGVPCWHTLPDIGNKAITDAFLIYTAIPQLLQRHFASHPSYVQLLQLFLNATFRSMLGQNYDLNAEASSEATVNDFTIERYKAQANYKTSYYSIYVPIAAPMYLAGITDAKHHDVVWSISSDLGLLCSVQDDYLDCFERVQRTGKSSSDIRNGKCTWLVVEAVRRASHEQRQRLKVIYGREDPASIHAVQTLYTELGVREAALGFMKQTYERISRRIAEQGAVPAPVLRYPLQFVSRSLLLEVD